MKKTKIDFVPVEGEDFVFVEHEAADFYSLKLKSGDFAGVIYTYGRVSLKEEKKQVRLSFTYKIEDTMECKYSKAELESSDAFRNYIGEVLAEILSTDQFQIGNNNGVQSSDNHSQESDT
jgi:hypothetical protein